jgi:TolA-binding protein
VKFRYLGVIAFLAAPFYAPAASREIQELQRDVGLLQEQVKALQASQNERFAALNVLVQQAVDAANRANTSVAVIQSGVQQNLRDQESKVVTPVVGLSSRMDTLATESRNLQNAVADLGGLMNKLQLQLTDLSNAVKVLQAPPAPPPGAPSSAPAPAASAAPGVPPVSASDLYANAQRDRMSGKLDLSLGEFSDYLKYYGNTDLAANAQFYVAYIHYSQGQYDTAVNEFDTVLEKYPSDNNKIPDALYYKGMALTRMGQRTKAAEEFKELLKRYPQGDLSHQACTQLTSMGLRCASPSAAAPAKSSPRRKE